eukprot:GHVO01049078.1.p1 GENE.GHVO01049078.1~~GHVO01049078.1.p1  ORF type:complete len:209 (+),score=18.93 GHVO01049078.1:304-930(+)
MIHSFHPQCPPFGFHTQSLGPWICLSWEKKYTKDESNRLFAQGHKWIHPSVTLSKLRNLKLDLFGLSTDSTILTLPIVACAWTYFERLLGRGAVHKGTRKLLGAVCLILAYKFYQGDGDLNMLLKLIESLDSDDNISSQDITRVEFHVYALLEFSLKTKFEHVLPHILQYLHYKESLSRSHVWSLGLESFKGKTFCADLLAEISFDIE